MGKPLKSEIYKALWIDPELKKQVRVVSAVRGEDMKAFTERALREELRKYQVKVEISQPQEQAA
jgi:hypothetical protein